MNLRALEVLLLVHLVPIFIFLNILRNKTHFSTILSTFSTGIAHSLGFTNLALHNFVQISMETVQKKSRVLSVSFLSRAHAAEVNSDGRAFVVECVCANKSQKIYKPDVACRLCAHSRGEGENDCGE